MNTAPLPNGHSAPTVTPAPRQLHGCESTFAIGDLHLAYGLLRAAFGMNILMHGAARLGSLSRFVDGVSAGFAGTVVPEALARVFAWTIAPLELVIGLLILVGLQTRVALIAGSLLMAALTFGVTLQQRWDVAGLQLTYVVVYALLVAALAMNRWSIDDWRARTAQ